MNTPLKEDELFASEAEELIYKLFDLQFLRKGEEELSEFEFRL